MPTVPPAKLPLDSTNGGTDTAIAVGVLSSAGTVTEYPLLFKNVTWELGSNPCPVMVKRLKGWTELAPREVMMMAFTGDPLVCMATETALENPCPTLNTRGTAFPVGAVDGI